MRKIIHVDMDCFYAAVEMRDDPSLRNKPLAVGGSPEGRGVVATANYEARKFGVNSAMPSHRALDKCPDLILISPNFDKYRSESNRIHDIFQDYSSQIEPLSLDEAYLDVTHSNECNGSATRIAEKICRRIKQERNLTASAGVAPNKFLAKVASDWNKPDGLKTIPPSEVRSFVKDLSVEHIPGVGDVTLEKLHNRNIQTCGDLQEYSRHELLETFGKWGLKLHKLCRGQDDRRVTTNRERKSLSVERTFSEDLTSSEEVQEALDSLYQKFKNRWEKKSLHRARIRGLFVKVKYADFSQVTRERKLHRLPEQSHFRELILNLWKIDPRNIRLIGVGVQLCSREKAKYRRAQKSLFS